MAHFTQRGGWWVAAQIVLFSLFGLALVVRGPDVSAGWARWVLGGAGAAALAAGFYLGIGGLRALGSGLTPYPEPVPGAELVDHGVYGLVRHPLYGAVVLGASGAALLAAALWPALGATALTGFFYAKSVHEERRLEAAYPGYEAYRSRVPRRLVPGLL